MTFRWRTSTFKVPAHRSARSGGIRPPVVVIPREKKAPKPSSGPPGVPVPIAPAWPIGEGPYYYQGLKASTPEYRVLLTLIKLGWHPDFQVAALGGRRIAGGQVLDILLRDHTPVVYIDVRSYWHTTAAQKANDDRKLFAIRAMDPTVLVLIVWEAETENPDLLYSGLLGKVGAHG